MKFSGKMCFKIILKKPGFHPLDRGYIFQKTTGVGGQFDPPGRLGISILPCYISRVHIILSVNSFGRSSSMELLEMLEFSCF